MKNSRKRSKNFFKNKTVIGIASLFLLLLSFPAFCGGPILVDDFGSGEPSRWPFDARSKKWVIHWKVDKGPLNSKINNQTAIDQWVKPLLEKWKNAALPIAGSDQPQTTVALDFVFDGKLDIDVTADDTKFLSADINDPLPTVIIFDEDGSITQKHFGTIACGEAKNCIAGFAFPIKRDASTKQILRGFVVLNGSLVDGINTADNKEMNPDQFKGVILHEMGHLLNLDHTQVNVEMAESCISFDCAGGDAIPTMYSASLSREQFLFHRDDIIAISSLYPSQVFQQNFCTIQGNVLNDKGEPMGGVNVIARNIKDPILDARSMVTGNLYPASSKDGQYFLPGIVPGQDYEVIFEELLQKYNDGGGFSPMGLDKPTGFGMGHIALGNGAASVRCNRGGEVIQIPSFKMAAVAVPGADPGASPLPASTVTEKKGWCQLNPKAERPSDIDWFLIFSSLSFGLLFVAWRCYKQPK